MSEQVACPRCGQPVEEAWRWCPLCETSLHQVPRGPEGAIFMTVLAGATAALGLARLGTILRAGGRDPVTGTLVVFSLLVYGGLSVQLVRRSPVRLLRFLVVFGVLLAILLSGVSFLLAVCPKPGVWK